LSYVGAKKEMTPNTKNKKKKRTEKKKSGEGSSLLFPPLREKINDQEENLQKLAGRRRRTQKKRRGRTKSQDKEGKTGGDGVLPGGSQSPVCGLQCRSINSHQWGEGDEDKTPKEGKKENQGGAANREKKQQGEGTKVQANGAVGHHKGPAASGVRCTRWHRKKPNRSKRGEKKTIQRQTGTAVTGNQKSCTLRPKERRGTGKKKKVRGRVPCPR